MGIMNAIKKGFSAAGSNLLLCLVSVLFIFIGFIVLGILLAFAIVSGNFPQLNPGMTPQQIMALNWAQVNWVLFVPIFLVILFLAGMIISFAQAGILAFIRGCIKEGSSKISDFFKYGAKYLFKIFLQYICMGAIGLFFAILGIMLVGLIGLSNVIPLLTAAVIIFQILLIILMVYMVLILMYGQIAVVIKDSGAIKSLGEGLGVLNRNIGRSIALFIPFAAVFVIFSIAAQSMAGIILALPVFIQVALNFVVSFLQIIISVAMIAAFMEFYLALAGKET